jgi:acyl-CoA thioesterase-1
VRAARVQTFVLVVAALALAVLPSKPAAATDRPVRIVVLGDSLSAGHGLPADGAFPAKLEQALRAKGIAVEIGNAGVSGDTAAGGLARLDWSVPEGTDAVIVELGANDMLRGLSPDSTKANLAAIIEKAKAAGAKVLLCGMKAQRNLGADYVAQFDAIYPDLARQEGVALYPFFMDGIVAADGTADRRLLQGDGLHPTEAGAALIVQRLMPALLPLLGDG